MASTDSALGTTGKNQVTLSRQVMLIVIGGLFVAFLATFSMSIHNAKIYFEMQLQRNSQDTATALGLSISEQQDKKMNTGIVLSKVNAVFNQGYFSHISVRNVYGKILVSRYLKSNQGEVPQWFIKIVAIQNDKKSALIMHGWQQIGEVFVQSDSGLAYTALWQTGKHLFILFLGLTVIIILISLLLIKMSFRPLKRILAQAEHIGQKQFYTLDKRPRLRELAILSETINTMGAKLKNYFDMQIEEMEYLRAKEYKDSLTGLANKRYFFQQLNQYLNNDNNFAPSFLLLIEFKGFKLFNALYGYPKGDNVLYGFSQKISEMVRNDDLFLLARLDGARFAVIILEYQNGDREQITDNISKQLEALLKNKDASLSYFIGVVPCLFGEAASSLLSRAEKAIQKAKQTQVPYFIEKNGDSQDKSFSNDECCSIIREALHTNQFHFYLQPVVFDKGIYHKECFVKLVRASKEIAAREFFPIADHCGLSGDLDLFVLQEMAEKNDKDILAINISASTIRNEEQQQKFLKAAESYSKQNRIKLHFEISEFNVRKNKENAIHLINRLVQLGYNVGLDRVGATLGSLDYFNTLNIAYIKLAAILSTDLEHNKLKQDLITHFLTIANTLDIILIATHIEEERQLTILKQLGVHYFQGNYLYPPSIQK